MSVRKNCFPFQLVIGSFQLSVDVILVVLFLSHYEQSVVAHIYQICRPLSVCYISPKVDDYDDSHEKFILVIKT